MATGVQHVIDQHPAASRTEETFHLVGLVITVPTDYLGGIRALQAALDRAGTRDLLDRTPCHFPKHPCPGTPTPSRSGPRSSPSGW
ncbi:hypothetical protein [Kitasatospora cineracea]|uniref:Uncharacterized protein n=1 Tax=Kitasatospora cineracea TaxID=88074 RepID=A0A3N4RES4_9ACTN|nr:hypothetical protein [Kitasatospora cineracea]RPE31802.1 hypothetical protein EDD38_0036 [Kitasatospora cineracea]